MVFPRRLLLVAARLVEQFLQAWRVALALLPLHHPSERPVADLGGGTPECDFQSSFHVENGTTAV